MSDNEKHTLRYHDLNLRLGLDINQPADATNPNSWNWESLLDLQPHESARVVGYLQHISTFEVDGEGNLLETIDTSYVSPPSLRDDFKIVLDLADGNVIDDKDIDGDDDLANEQMRQLNAIDNVEEFVRRHFGEV